MNRSIRRYMLRYRLQSIYTEENVRRAIAGHRRVLKTAAFYLSAAILSGTFLAVSPQMMQRVGQTEKQAGA